MTELTYSPLLVHLLKGVIYAEKEPSLWQELLENYHRIKDYFRAVGLEVFLDETEGYAFLRQPPVEEEEGEERPKLVSQRPLSYHATLLAVVLRKKLLEMQASGENLRLVLRRDEIMDNLRVFLPEQTNEARLANQMDRALNKLIELGFVRRLANQNFEVNRILKAFINADELNRIQAELQTYAKSLNPQEEQYEPHH